MHGAVEALRDACAVVPEDEVGRHAKAIIGGFENRTSHHMQQTKQRGTKRLRSHARRHDRTPLASVVLRTERNIVHGVFLEKNPMHVGLSSDAGKVLDSKDPATSNRGNENDGRRKDCDTSAPTVVSRQRLRIHQAHTYQKQRA